MSSLDRPLNTKPVSTKEDRIHPLLSSVCLIRGRKEEMMMPRKVLVVEDYCELLVFLGKFLALRGWDAILAGSAGKH